MNTSKHIIHTRKLIWKQHFNNLDIQNIQQLCISARLLIKPLSDMALDVNAALITKQSQWSVPQYEPQCLLSGLS